MSKRFVPFLVVFFTHCALAVELVAPREGETVETIRPEVKAYLDLPFATRRDWRFSPDTPAKAMLRTVKDKAKPIRFVWEGEKGPYRMSVVRLPDGREFFSTNTTVSSVEISGRLEIARQWKWTVSEGAASVSGMFYTEDRAPRIVSWPGVPNVRDIGGRLGLNGRRIKQGLLYRSGGLNDNAAFGNSPTNRVPPTVPGTARLNEAGRKFILATTGIRTDVDFRNDWECFGMTGSPLGPEVKWLHCNYLDAYGGMATPLGRSSVARAFAALIDTNNYPMVFHCIGGADRTGTFAYLIGGLLGADAEELARDYHLTWSASGGTAKRHNEWFDEMLSAIRKLPGEDLAEKMEKYFVSLGFTEADVDSFRDWMLE